MNGSVQVLKRYLYIIIKIIKPFVFDRQGVGIHVQRHPLLQSAFPEATCPGYACRLGFHARTLTQWLDIEFFSRDKLYVELVLVPTYYQTRERLFIKWETVICRELLTIFIAACEWAESISEQSGCGGSTHCWEGVVRGRDCRRLDQPPHSSSNYLCSNMAERVQANLVQFLPFVSRLDTGFWHELGLRKLEKYKLSEDQNEICGQYSNCKWL